MRYVAILIAGLILGGCDADSKLVGICTDIARDSTVDPSSLAINSSTIVRKENRISDVVLTVKAKYGKNPPEEVESFVDRLYHSESMPPTAVVDIDFTANGSNGKVRRGITCSYQEDIAAKTFLVAVTVNGKIYDLDNIDSLFRVLKRPAGLDSLNFVK